MKKKRGSERSPTTKKKNTLVGDTLEKDPERYTIGSQEYMGTSETAEEFSERTGGPLEDIEEGSGEAEKGSGEAEKGSGEAGKCRDLGHKKPAEFFREVRARVHVSKFDVPEGRAQGKTQLWAYGVELVAKLLDLTPNDVRIYHSRGDLDLGDLESVCMEWLRRVRSPGYQREWPLSPLARGERRVESERRRAEKRRLKELKWTAPDTGEVKAVELPDLEDL